MCSRMLSASLKERKDMEDIDWAVERLKAVFFPDDPDNLLIYNEDAEEIPFELKI